MNICIITHDSLTHQGLLSIADDKWEVSWFEFLGDAIATVEITPYDVILVDIAADDYMPNIGSLCAASNSPLALIAANEDRNMIRLALDAGAKGCISTRASLAEIKAAIAFAAAGGTIIPPSLLKIGAAPNILTQGGLTSRQAAVLRHIKDGLSNKEIARRLAIAEGTVKLHVTAVLKSLGARNRTDAARIAYEQNLGVGMEPSLT